MRPQPAAHGGRRAWLALVAALGGAPAAAGLTPSDYSALVGRYRGGAFREAALAALQTAPDALAAAARALGDGTPCDEACLQAAALMHTEAALLARGAGRVDLEGVHLQRARELAGRARDAAFRHDWLLLAGYHLQGQALVGPALELFEEGLKTGPKDEPRALLALGTIHELTATLDDLQPRGPGEAPPAGSDALPHFQRQAERERRARKAEELYRRALKADPQLAEAHLRLGRVLALRRASDARRELEWVLQNAKEPHLLTLARLFLGRLAQDERRFGDAVEHYQAALALEPTSPAAHWGLSFARRAAGDGGGADASARAGLRPSGAPAPARNAWVDYHLGLARLVAPSLEVLRARVRS